MKLSEKCAIVTGSSQGIGLAIAKQLITDGAKVVFNAPDAEKHADLVSITEQINQQMGDTVAHAICADISKEDQVETLINKGTECLGGLDILINNAGIESTHSALDLEMAEWDKIMNVNLRGAFMCARAAARIMVQQGRGGVILGNSSIHENVSRLGLTHYAISKAGLRMMHKSLALEWAEHNIRVVGIAPGAIETPMNKKEIENFGKHYFEEWIPLSRIGNGDDVAKTVSFLVSEDASYITGTTIEIDGGYVLNLVRYDPREGS